jgi:transcriptional regulator with GAF, ATPase, and Fis domain
MATREFQLARALVDLADTLVADFDVVDLLQRLVEDSVDLLGASQAGLLLSDQRGGIRVMASTSEHARLLELYQVQNHEGPCLDCVRTGLPVLVPDLAEARGRWPRFAAAALEQDFRSVHTLPLRLRTEVLGALGLFRTAVGPLDPEDVEAAQALADIATIGILQQRTIARCEVLAEQLQTALNSRVVIEQAKGVLAATGRIGMDSAYVRLRGYCRPRNLPLTATAAAVADGSLDAATVLAG